MEYEGNHCVDSYIEKCLIGVFGGMLSFGDFSFLRNVFHAGNEQAKQHSHQKRKALLEETVMYYPVFHSPQI